MAVAKKRTVFMNVILCIVVDRCNPPVASAFRVEPVSLKMVCIMLTNMNRPSAVATQVCC
jgi:hypothetical protein